MRKDSCRGTPLLKNHTQYCYAEFSDSTAANEAFGPATDPLRYPPLDGQPLWS